MKTIHLPPFAPTLIESTRSLGYSLETAIADIIDNSISANASHIDINYRPGISSYISILDDGIGMDAAKINLAMQYGSTNPLAERSATDLGRFGLGLKTASLSQCRCLTVLSKQGSQLEGRRWDLDYIGQVQDWNLQILEEEDFLDLPLLNKLKQLESGTLVIWQNLDRLQEGEVTFDDRLGRLMDDVREHLSLVFHRFLSGERGREKIEIIMNGFPVKPKDPFLSKKSSQTMPDERIVLNGQTVIVKPFLLPHISKMTKEEIQSLGGKDGLAKNQGFYIYRNKRLIVWGTWFRMTKMDDTSQLARIQVDIPNTLDSLWTLDIKKSKASPPEEIKRNLIRLVPRLADQSRKTWSVRGKRETDTKNQPIWMRYKTRQDDHYYQINRDHPAVAYMLNRSNSKDWNVIFQLIEQNLPLNQIYIDMNSEGTVGKNTPIEEENVLETEIRSYIETISDSEFVKIIFNSLALKEPYCKYPELIEKLVKEYVK